MQSKLGNLLYPKQVMGMVAKSGFMVSQLDYEAGEDPML